MCQSCTKLREVVCRHRLGSRGLSAVWLKAGRLTAELWMPAGKMTDGRVRRVRVDECSLTDYQSTVAPQSVVPLLAVPDDLSQLERFG